MDKQEIRVGDLVFYLKEISNRVFDGTILAINEDGTFKIHDETSGGTFASVPASRVFTDRSEAEARDEQNFKANLEAYKAGIGSVEDLIRFMFETDLVVHEDGTNWAARKAAKDKAQELLGIELVDFIDGK